MARKRTSSNSDSLTQLAAGELGGPATTINYTTHIQQAKPDFTSLPSVYEQCRYFARESSFLKVFLPLKRSVCNHGMRLVAIEDGKQEQLDEWLLQDSAPLVDKFVDPQTQETVQVESTTSNAESVGKWIEDAWTNFLLLDADIATWQDGVDGAVSLGLERVQYTDTMGLEIVRYTHGLSRVQLEQLSKEMQKVFATPTIIINPKNKIHFKVLKRSGRGEGLPVPALFSVFRLLDEIESKQFGMNALSFALRQVKRVHRIGYEIKSGQNTGKAISHTLFNTKRSNLLQAHWKDKQGFEDYACNWDEKTEFPWPDSKYFDTIMWKSTDQRLYEWAGPIAQMMVSKGVMPYLSNLIKATVGADRARFGAYAASVVNRGFSPPVPTRLDFSDAIFSESRLAAEMVKFGVQNGLLSWDSGTAACGYSPEVEQTRKLAEAQDPDALEKFAPMYASAQGSTPALGETSGRLAAASAGAAGASPKAKGKAPGAKDGRQPGTPNSMPSNS